LYFKVDKGTETFEKVMKFMETRMKYFKEKIEEVQKLTEVKVYSITFRSNNGECEEITGFLVEGDTYPGKGWKSAKCYQSKEKKFLKQWVPDKRTKEGKQFSKILSALTPSSEVGWINLYKALSVDKSPNPLQGMGNPGIINKGDFLLIDYSDEDYKKPTSNEVVDISEEIYNDLNKNHVSIEVEV